MKRRVFLSAAAALAVTLPLTLGTTALQAQSKELVYITPSLNVSFWRYVATGVEAAAEAEGYSLQTLDSNNDGQTQLKNVQDAITRGVAGIVISPTDSSTAPSALDLAEKAGIPVTIADIGTTGGNYISFVASDNLGGARGIGDALGAALKEKGWTDGSYGIIAIPQTRINGQLRTQGFRDAMKAAGMTKEAPMQQMQTFTADESFRFAQNMLTANPDLRAIFIQSDQQSIGALRAVQAARKSDSVLVAAFDGTPELFELIVKGDIIGSGMQQPYLMGFRAGEALIEHLNGGTPDKEIVVPILIGTTANAEAMLDEIKLNVFAGEM
ncbi:MAG: ribose ABC transporter substrate-binding protein RbsB [Rhodospirillales bacterium]